LTASDSEAVELAHEVGAFGDGKYQEVGG
jgi:hypothetical protein